MTLLLNKTNYMAYTEQCTSVKRRVDGTYKRCKRVFCLFAHSLEELRLNKCRYGSECQRGKNNCKFFHPYNETKAEWITRRKIYLTNRSKYK